MTPGERLTQAEKLLETAARSINQHSETMIRNAEDIAQLRATSAETLQMFSELAAIVRRHQEQIEQHQQQIRQNQEEILRIWNYLRRDEN